MKEMEKRIFLQGKIDAPKLAKNFISRARLHPLIESSLKRSCVSIVAPAGFGKTLLVSDWAHNGSTQPMWLTIEEDDNNVESFWIAFVLACSAQGLHTPTAKELMCCLSDEIGSTAWVNAFFNEVMQVVKHAGRKVAIVLDNMHHITNPSILTALARLIRYTPENLHFFLLSRNGLPKTLLNNLSLDYIAQLNAEDLLFTYDDCENYLASNQSGELFASEVRLSVDAYKSLYQSTDGWPYFICQTLDAMLTKSDASVDYASPFNGAFIEQQVLNFLDEGALATLTKLACFSRLGADMMEQCLIPKSESANLQWLVHGSALFTSGSYQDENLRVRQPLRNHLIALAEQSDALSPTHFKNVYQWYVAKDCTFEAISVCFDFGYWQSAVHLIESKYQALIKAGRWHEVDQWFSQLPNHVVQQRPMLLMLAAWNALFACKPMKATVNLRDAERLLADESRRIDHPDNLYNKFGKQSVRQEISQLQAWIQALYINNNADTLSEALNQVGSIEQNGVVFRYLCGLNALYNNRPQEAMTSLGQVVEQALAEQHGSVLSKAVEALGWAHYLTGALSQWHTISVSLKERLQASERLSHIESAWLSRSRIMGAIEQNDVDEHTRDNLKVDNLLGRNMPLDSQYNLLLAQAIVKIHDREYKQAARVLSDAEVLACELPPIVCKNSWSVAGLKALVQLKQGMREEALFWAECARKTEKVDTLSSQHEKHITAEIFLVSGKTDEAIALSKEVANWAIQTGSDALLTRAKITESIAHQLLKHETKAQKSFDEALRIGRAAGNIIPFIRSESEMTDLLSQARQSGRFPGYVGKLINAIGVDIDDSADDAGLEVLSKRELQVLELMATGISNPQIAETLCRSLGTVKIHVHNIYRKLGVPNRVTAINKYMMSMSNVA